MIRLDKDFILIKDVFFNYFLETGKLLTAEGFNNIKPIGLKQLREYLMDYHISYNDLVFNYLGFVRITANKYSKDRVYNKIILTEQFKDIILKKLSKNETILAKNIKKDFGITLKELNEIFGMNFVQFLESFGIVHSLSEIRANCNFDWSIAFNHSTYRHS